LLAKKELEKKRKGRIAGRKKTAERGWSKQDGNGRGWGPGTFAGCKGRAGKHVRR